MRSLCINKNGDYKQANNFSLFLCLNNIRFRWRYLCSVSSVLLKLNANLTILQWKMRGSPRLKQTFNQLEGQISMIEGLRNTLTNLERGKEF